MGYSINGPTKVITLTAGTTSVSVRDLWSRWVDWFLTSDNSKYLPAFVNVGGDDIDAGAGTKIPIYAFLMNGWKIKPQEANHTLTISDGILLVNGGGDPFNNTTGAYTVRINYQQPVQAISFSADGGGTAPTASQIADAVWDEAIVEHANTGSTGEALADAGGAGNPWSSITADNDDTGTFGEMVQDIKKGLTSSQGLILGA